LPNALFILRLYSLAGRPGATYPVHFFVGEFVKVLATAGLLAVAMVGYSDMHWLSLLAGWVVALHAGFFAFWKKF
jgi:ATP synthase protein I